MDDDDESYDESADQLDVTTICNYYYYRTTHTDQRKLFIRVVG